MSDLETLTEFCVEHFARSEPHLVALGITGEDDRIGFNWLLAKCLHFPYSLKVIEKCSGKLVGLRLLSIGHRDASLDYNPYEVIWSDVLQKRKKLEDMVADLVELLWDGIDPEVTKVLRQELTLIVPEHCRKGIARYITELNLDFDQLRKEGVEGIFSEALTLASQNLMLSMGHKCVAIPDYDWKDQLTDGTKTAMGLFKDIRI